MHKKLAAVAICIVALAVSAAAQVTGSGTSGTVPVFTGTSTVGNSPIAVSGSNVGIGTTAPGASLDVRGSLSVGSGSFADVVLQRAETPAGSYTMYISSGTGIPQNTYPTTIGDSNNGAYIGLTSGNTVSDPYGGGLSLNAYGSGTFNTSNAITFTRRIGVNTSEESMRIPATGNVGIGTISPGAKLEVNGNLKLTSGSGASVTFADGTVQSTAWTGSLCGGDYAESVDVTGGRTLYEPGDVLVVDADHPGQFLKATERYSTLVAGIYSTKPGLLGRRQTTDPKNSTTEVPMAMVGIVPTKVSVENGSIKPGDLLVTSSISGHAMKGTDRGLLAGAIVGKALGTLESGTGVIEVLVSLQ